jgi:hypothetical protein
MAIIVEDGTGKADAEAYVDVSFSDAYHEKRGNEAWAALSSVVKEQCIVKATDYMVELYNGRWKGMRRFTTQSLDWPRVGVVLDEFSAAEYGTVDVPYYIVPEEVKKACAELALKASAGALTADLGQGVLRETVGPITVQYDSGSSRQTTYVSVARALSRYMKSSSSMAKLVRT